MEFKFYLSSQNEFKIHYLTSTLSTEQSLSRYLAYYVTVSTAPEGVKRVS